MIPSINALTGSIVKCGFKLQTNSPCQVVADKQLVKHLQKEVARLEAELRSPEPASSMCLRSLLMEKDLKIQQVFSTFVFYCELWLIDYVPTRKLDL